MLPSSQTSSRSCWLPNKTRTREVEHRAFVSSYCNPPVPQASLTEAHDTWARHNAGYHSHVLGLKPSRAEALLQQECGYG
eukprot:966927-Pelagomonas_calceolata.AAC.1